MMKTNELLPTARTFLQELKVRSGLERVPVLVATSGGTDSMALLHLMATWGKEAGFDTTAAHFNHQLRGERANRDEAFVQDYCSAHNIPFLVGRGNTRLRALQSHESLEEAGRMLRYTFLRQMAQEGKFRYIFTAHHAEDSAETMLLNLVRGTGAAGLAGIPPIQDDLICRPFLDITRAELEDYGRMVGLSHVEDETNETNDTSRNLLRHKVMPVLRQINPRAVENMVRSASLLSQQAEAVDAQAQALVARSAPIEGGYRLDWSALGGQPKAVQTGAVLILLTKVGGHRKNLSYGHAASVLALCNSLHPGAQVSLPNGLMARDEGRALVIKKVFMAWETVEVPIELEQSISFDTWTVTLGEEQESGESWELNAEALTAGELRVTRWRPGDYMTLPGSRGGRSLKRLYVDRNILFQERDTLPVLRLDGRVIAAARLGVQEVFTPRDGEESVWVTFYQEKEEN